jgi:protein O-mannosyl-transferase
MVRVPKYGTGCWSYGGWRSRECGQLRAQRRWRRAFHIVLSFPHPARVYPAAAVAGLDPDPVPRGRGKSPGATAACLVVVVLSAIIPYANATRDGFARDDGPLIVDNPCVQDGFDAARIIATPVLGNLYRPVTVFSFRLDQSWAPRQAWFFHAANVALHALVSVLVFLLARVLFHRESIALPAALLFAVHPVHTEAVAYIAGRPEILAALFGLLSVLLALRAEDATSRAGRVALRVVSALTFLLAVGSKESAVVIFPLILYARAVLRGDSFTKGVGRVLREGDWLTYAACLAVVLGARWYVLGTIATVPIEPVFNILVGVPTIDRLRSAVAIGWDYFGLLIMPVVLSADYSYDQVPVVTTWTDTRLLLGLGLLALVVVGFSRCRPATRVALALSLAPLAITGNFLFPIGTIKAERLLYSPSIGCALLAGVAFSELWARSRYRKLASVLLASVVVAFGARTWVRTGDWKNDLTIALSTVDSAPRSARAHEALGELLRRTGRYDLAREQLRKAFEIYPYSALTAYMTARAFEDAGDLSGALLWIDRAFEIKPDLFPAYAYRCGLRVRAGDYAGAITVCRKELRSEPANAMLWKGLGFAYLGASEKIRGREILAEAGKLRPDDAEVIASLSTSCEAEEIGCPPLSGVMRPIDP